MKQVELLIVLFLLALVVWRAMHFLRRYLGRKTVVILVVLVSAVLFYNSHIKPVSFDDVRVSRMHEPLRAIVQEYGLARIHVSYHRSHRLSVHVYTWSDICHATERTIFLECRRVVLAEGRRLYPANGVLREASIDGIDSPSFDFRMIFFNRRNGKALASYSIGKTPEGEKAWFYGSAGNEPVQLILRVP